VALFGVEVTREEIFPILCEMQVRIRPPEAVAISPHLLKALKWGKDQRTKQPRVQESLMVREVAHAQGVLTVYLQIPTSEEMRLSALLNAIGYWGQTDSFASCLEIRQADPPDGEYVLRLQQYALEGQLQPFFSGLATEFRDNQVSWAEVTASPIAHKKRGSQQALVLDLYIWPLVLLQEHGGKKLLQRRSLREALM